MDVFSTAWLTAVFPAFIPDVKLCKILRGPDTPPASLRRSLEETQTLCCRSHLRAARRGSVWSDWHCSTDAVKKPGIGINMRLHTNESLRGTKHGLSISGTKKMPLLYYSLAKAIIKDGRLVQQQKNIIAVVMFKSVHSSRSPERFFGFLTSWRINTSEEYSRPCTIKHSLAEHTSRLTSYDWIVYQTCWLSPARSSTLFPTLS